MGRRLVASYCPVFLRREMRHIHRQVTQLKRFRTFVITPERANPELFPFDDIEMLAGTRLPLLETLRLKYIQRQEKLVYRGESRALQEILHRRQPELLHVYFGHAGVHLLPFLRNSRLPFVVSFHGLDVASRTKGDYSGKLRELVSLATLVLVRSESLGRRVVRIGCDEGKIRLNRTAIPVDNFPVHVREFPTDGNWRLIQACRLIEKKGLFTALAAFQEFRTAFPSARFTIAGEGPLLEPLRSRAEELGMSGSVEFAGFQSEQGLLDLYRSSHIFLHPSETTSSSDQEGVPNSMLEAMSTGLPVVATRHGGIPEAVQDGKDGMLCDEGDAEGLAATLLRLACDSYAWQALGRNAAESVRREFSPEAQIESLEISYEEAISTHRLQAVK